MNTNEETLPMPDGLTEIRRQLLWDRIREINTTMPEEMFQAFKAMPVSQWIKAWIEAGLDATEEDLAEVHKMLWPAQ